MLLCSFTKVNEGDKVLDLCTGNGVIPILLKGRTKGSRFSGLEIQDINVDMAKEVLNITVSANLLILLKEM